MLMPLISRFKQPRKFRGQGLVEFALIFPVLLLVVFVIVELARVLHAWMAIENGARFGVRYAVTGEWDDTYCPGGVCSTEGEEDLARIPSIGDAARVGAVAILRNDGTDVNVPGFFKITVCSAKPLPVPLPFPIPTPEFTFTAGNPSDPSASTCIHNPDSAEVEDAGDPGDTVIVSIDFTHPLITPFLTAVWPDLHLRAQRTGVVEQYRTSRVFGLPIVAFTTPPTPTETYTPVPPTETSTQVPSPTPSSTPTATPLPSCSNIIFVQDRLNGDDFEIRVRNNNVAPAYLSSATLTWQKVVPSQEVNFFRFDGNLYWGGDSDTSPTGPISSWVKLNGGGDSAWWEADFKPNDDLPDPLWGTYSADLIFGFDGIGLTCPISGFVNQVQLPTNTPRPPTATRTSGPPTTPTNTRTPRPPTATNTEGPPPTNTPTATDEPDATPTIDYGDG